MSWSIKVIQLADILSDLGSEQYELVHHSLASLSVLLPYSGNLLSLRPLTDGVLQLRALVDVKDISWNCNIGGVL